MTDFNNKVVLITGASSGIGAETALHFAAAGASLALTGRNAERLRNVAAKCVEKGASTDEVFVIQADLNIEDDVNRIMQLTIEKFKALHILVNNAGGGEIGIDILNPSILEEYDRTMRLNVRSVVQLTKLATPQLIRSKGCIVNTSSVLAQRNTGMFKAMAYSVSKATINQFTRALALELGPKGVRVNAISPGTIITPATCVTGTPDEIRQNPVVKSLHPIGHVGEVDDAAAVIVFLASSAASFINGAIIPVDGGWSILCPAQPFPLPL